MTSIGIFYGSDTGNSKVVAEKIARQLQAQAQDIADCSIDDLGRYDFLILGTSTVNQGELQPDWDDLIDELEEAELSGKKVALFGLGDQVDYPDTFLDAMGELHELLEGTGAERVGQWPVDGYEFTESRACIDGEFVGLALDEDRQAQLSDKRIHAWLESLPYS